MTLTGGSRFESEIHNGASSGFTVYHLANGIKIRGRVIDGKLNGYGIVTYPDYTVKGKFSEGRLNGRGMITCADGEKLFGLFENEKLIRKLSGNEK